MSSSNVTGTRELYHQLTPRRLTVRDSVLTLPSIEGIPCNSLRLIITLNEIVYREFPVGQAHKALEHGVIQKLDSDPLCFVRHYRIFAEL